MENQETITDYRAAILTAMTDRRDSDGLPLITHADAGRLLAMLSDDELAFGIDFNTPEDIAELLLDPYFKDLAEYEGA